MCLTLTCWMLFHASHKFENDHKTLLFYLVVSTTWQRNVQQMQEIIEFRQFLETDGGSCGTSSVHRTAAQNTEG